MVLLIRKLPALISPSRLSPSLDYPDCFLFLTDSFLPSCSLQVITKESLLLAQVTAEAVPVRFPHYKLFPVLTVYLQFRFMVWAFMGL